MKCIKERCPYYIEHDFYSSYFKCTLPIVSPSFKKDKSFECLIDDEVTRLRARIAYMEDLKDELEDMLGSRMATQEELDDIE